MINYNKNTLCPICNRSLNLVSFSSDNPFKKINIYCFNSCIKIICRITGFSDPNDIEQKLEYDLHIVIKHIESEHFLRWKSNIDMINDEFNTNYLSFNDFINDFLSNTKDHPVYLYLNNKHLL